MQTLGTCITEGTDIHVKYTCTNYPDGYAAGSDSALFQFGGKDPTHGGVQFDDKCKGLGMVKGTGNNFVASAQVLLKRVVDSEHWAAGCCPYRAHSLVNRAEGTAVARATARRAIAI